MKLVARLGYQEFSSSFNTPYYALLYKYISVSTKYQIVDFAYIFLMHTAMNSLGYQD